MLEERKKGDIFIEWKLGHDATKRQNIDKKDRTLFNTLGLSVQIKRSVTPIILFSADNAMLTVFYYVVDI